MSLRLRAPGPWKPVTEAERAGGGTLTARGVIPHFVHNGLRCPVRLITREFRAGRMLETNSQGLGFPMLRQGAYVFALPGGYSVLKGKPTDG